VQVVISLLKVALDTAGADGMSALSSPYERKDLPVAEKQSWTPVPPYIPRIQLQQLCNVATLPPSVENAPWWKLPFFNRKSHSSSESVSLSSASLSSSSTAARSASALAALAEDLLNPKPVTAPPIAADTTSNQIVSGTASAMGITKRPISKPPPLTQGPWKRPKHGDEDKVVDVQHHVISSRGSVLLAQTLALKQAHDVLSWQVIFSGMTPCNLLSFPSCVIARFRDCFFPYSLLLVGGLLFFAIMAFRSKIIAWARGSQALADNTLRQQLQSV
jgi:hypothetical protein